MLCIEKTPTQWGCEVAFTENLPEPAIQALTLFFQPPLLIFQPNMVSLKKC